MTWLLLASALVVIPLGSADVLRLSTGGERLTAGMSMPGRWFLLVLLAAVVGVVLLTNGLALAIASALAGLCGERLVEASRGRARAARHRARVLASLRRWIAELEAGRQIEASRPDELAELEAVTYALDVSRGSGAPLAHVLGVVVDDLAAEDDRERAVAVKLSTARSSAVLMAFLPAVGIAMGSATGAHPGKVLLHTPLGHVLVLGAVTFEAVGLTWVDLIARRAAR